MAMGAVVRRSAARSIVRRGARAAARRQTMGHRRTGIADRSPVPAARAAGVAGGHAGAVRSRAACGQRVLILLKSACRRVTFSRRAIARNAAASCTFHLASTAAAPAYAAASGSRHRLVADDVESGEKRWGEGRASVRAPRASRRRRRGSRERERLVQGAPYLASRHAWRRCGSCPRAHESHRSSSEESRRRGRGPRLGRIAQGRGSIR